jgi:hypothetical protein
VLVEDRHFNTLACCLPLRAHGRDHHLWIMHGALAKRNFKVCMGVKPAAVTCAVTTSLTFVAQDTKAHLSLSFLKSLLVHIFLQRATDAADHYA